QAAALLARVLLAQERDEEALEATRFAEARGGEDLKTTIAWLGVRAEALARGGEIDDALALAERATRMAEPTDALADKADELTATMKAWAEMAPGAHLATAEIYAHTEHVLAGLVVGRGASEGVEFEVPYGFLGEVRDGLGVLTESFEPEDRELLMRRFNER